MPTVVTKTIKPAGGGDYTTLAAWATARLGVALIDTVERAEIYAGDAGSFSLPAASSCDDTSEIQIAAAKGHECKAARDTSTSACVGRINLPYSGPGKTCKVRCESISGLYAGNVFNNEPDSGHMLSVYGCIGIVDEASSYAAFRSYNIAENCIAISPYAKPYGFVSNVATVCSCCTAYGLARGFYRSSGTKPILTNCLAQNCADGFNGTFSAASDYNISDIAGDAPGAHSKTGVVQFVDAAAKDYHLSPADTVARGAGVNLTASGITTDIDGDARPATGAWDIGADQVAESPTPTPGGGRKPWGRDPWGRPAWGSAMCGWRHP